MQTETDHGPTLISIMIGVYFFGLFVMDTGARVLVHLWEVLSV